MTTIKSTLRKVQVMTNHVTKTTMNGYFHRWITTKDDKGSETIEALVELENGIMQRCYTYQLQFTSDGVLTPEVSNN